MVLGEGGFGRVYKGWVDERTLNPAKSNAGVIVAVKKLNPENVQGLQEWQVIHPIPSIDRLLIDSAPFLRLDVRSIPSVFVCF